MTRVKKKSKTTDAVEILYNRLYKGRPKRIAELQQAQIDDDVARSIYEMRTKSGLSQQQLAEKIGTTASVICRLESADYSSHSLTMLKRIATALDKRLEIRFVDHPRTKSA